MSHNQFDFLSSSDGTLGDFMVGDAPLPDWKAVLPLHSADFQVINFDLPPPFAIAENVSSVAGNMAMLGAGGAFDAFNPADFHDAKSGANNKGGGGGHGGGGGGGGTLLSTYTSGDPNIADSQEYNITIKFSGSWTADQQSIVTHAADLLSSIITGDVMDDIDPNTNSPVDDIVINMSTGRIDGSGNPLFGNILAQTTLTSYREANTVNEFLPVSADIKLDSTDLKNSVSGGWFGTWDDIILHEMTHAIGFSGLIFSLLQLVDTAGNFTGANAMAAYSAAGNVPVPVESGGGSGTAGSHWSETLFAPNGTPMPNELMTGYVAYNEQTYLSDTTVGALADLGYQVSDPSPGSDYLAVNLLA